MTCEHPTRVARLAAVGGLCAVLIAACGSSTGLTAGDSGGSGSMSAMRTTRSDASGVGQMKTAIGSEDPDGTPRRLLKVDGITPIPTQRILSADWQHMRIGAMAMTAVPFAIFDGRRERMVKIPRHVSFHLMVTLNDARTNEPIPYASVWATITRNGKVVYDERQWPMIAEYLGPHYGNNVALPGPGTYRLSLLISPPVSARHVEYRNVWLTPHRVSAMFRWRPAQ